MKSRLFPFNDPICGPVFTAMADAFAPAHDATIGEVAAAPRVGFWERLDRWVWNFVQKEREAYLSQAQDLADLEERIRRLDSYGSRYY